MQKPGSNPIIKSSGRRLNQRAGERLARSNRVTVRVLREGADEPIEARLVDVSEGGIGFDTTASLADAECLRIRVEIETTQIVSLRALFVEGQALVRRRAELEPGARWRIGAAWAAMDRAEQEKWKTFLGKARPLLF